MSFQLPVMMKCAVNRQGTPTRGPCFMFVLTWPLLASDCPKLPLPIESVQSLFGEVWNRLMENRLSRPREPIPTNAPLSQAPRTCKSPWAERLYGGRMLFLIRKMPALKGSSKAPQSLENNNEPAIQPAEAEVGTTNPEKSKVYHDRSLRGL